MKELIDTRKITFVRIRLICLNYHRLSALQTNSKVDYRVTVSKPVRTKLTLVRADVSEARLKQQKDTPKGGSTHNFYESFISVQ